MMYQIVNQTTIKRLSDSAFITIGSETGDYADYLRWIEAGNQPVTVAIDFNSLKSAKLSDLALKRQSVENGGITVPGIGLIPTGEKTRAIIDQTISSLERGILGPTVAWKLSPGVFVDLTEEQLLTIAQSIAQFVDQCFRHERELSDRIMAATIQPELDAVNLDEGWPS